MQTLNINISLLIDFFCNQRTSWIPQSSTFWRRKINDSGYYFDDSFRMAGDFEFFCRISQSYQLKYVNEVFSQFRVHESSLTSKYVDLNRKEVEKIRNRYGTNIYLVGKLMEYVGILLYNLLNVDVRLIKIFYKLKEKLE
jgi:hypothetical protein